MKGKLVEEYLLMTAFLSRIGRDPNELQLLAVQ